MSSKFAGVTFDDQAATPSDDAIIRRAILADGILTGCEVSYTGSTLTMTAGQLMICGRQVKHPSTQNWAVADATTGFARLVLTIDLTRTSSKDTFEQVVDTVEYASAVDGFADLVQEDINASGTKYQIVAAVVSLTTGGISGIVSQLGQTSAVMGEKSVIIVTAPTGSTVTCAKGTTVKTATEKNGEWWFRNLDIGEWTLKATLSGQTATQTVNITQFDVYRVTMSFVKIYGISRNVTSSSPVWARTDEAVGKTATASVGTSAGASDFDNCYPWSGIVRETLSTGDVMVKIPRFWYRRYKEGDIEYIKIADKATTGFTLHPLFNHAGIESDCAYVGAYNTSSNNKSVSGARPQVSQTRATFRANAKAKGTGWSLIDIAAVSAIQMLCMVEFATNNVQSAIGVGYASNDSDSGPLSTGSCNNVANLTGRPAGTDGKTGVVYRGIENFWGNIWEFVDGVNWNGGTYYVCNNPANYADGTATNYTALSFKGVTNWDASYITEEGLDTGNNPHVMLPSAAGSGSETTYYCDACYSDTGWRVLLHGGRWSTGSGCGLFMIELSYSSSDSGLSFGSRLLYIPS